MASGTPQAKRGIFGLAPNVVWMGVVSFLNDLSSDMIFPFIPIFLTSVLGASYTFVGLVEGVADATASILKIISGWLADRWQRRKPLVVLGYSLSAVSKPILAFALAPWHVLAVRFLDRVGKGSRDAPRDALISFSSHPQNYGRAFGFHRAMDTAGAAIGPLAAVAILPFINQNYRILFLLSFAASFLAVVILGLFVREVSAAGNRHDGSSVSVSVDQSIDTNDTNDTNAVRRANVDIRAGVAKPTGALVGRLTGLGAPYFLFLGVATLGSLGRASEAFLILRAREVGTLVAILPLLYMVSNITFALLSTPLGAVADRLGKRNTFTAGLLVFAGAYFGFAFGATTQTLWLLFVLYGFSLALTEGVGRAIVAGLVAEDVRATAFGLYSASTGLALLPASVVFGILAERFGSHVAFSYGAGLALIAAFGFLWLRNSR